MGRGTAAVNSDGGLPATSIERSYEDEEQALKAHPGYILLIIFLGRPYTGGVCCCVPLI